MNFIAIKFDYDLSCRYVAKDVDHFTRSFQEIRIFVNKTNTLVLRYNRVRIIRRNNEFTRF